VDKVRSHGNVPKTPPDSHTLNTQEPCLHPWSPGENLLRRIFRRAVDHVDLLEPNHIHSTDHGSPRTAFVLIFQLRPRQPIQMAVGWASLEFNCDTLLKPRSCRPLETPANFLLFSNPPLLGGRFWLLGEGDVALGANGTALLKWIFWGFGGTFCGETGNGPRCGQNPWSTPRLWVFSVFTQGASPPC
jgi:hypothetical protein